MTLPASAPDADLTALSDAARPSAAMAPNLCFHCGLPAPAGGRWRVRIDGGDRVMCCAGCQAVAQAIVDAGLDDYYRHRSGPAAGPNAIPAELEALSIYDEPELQSRFVRDGHAGAETTLMIEGMRCGACVWLIERTLASQPGVSAASVNFATERAVLRWDPSQTRLSTLLARVGAIGYQARPYDAQQREAQLTRTTRSLFRRLFVAGIGMMQVMMYAFPSYTAAPSEIEWQYDQLMRWASLLLTLPVVLYSAQPFFAGALRDLRAGSPGMDVPVSLGLAAAFGASVLATLQGQGEVYFDSVTMFVFLLLGARYLEWMARRRASRAVDAMAAALPERVHRLVGLDPSSADETAMAAARTEVVPAVRVEPGDLLRVGVGERIAVDGLIVAGSTAIDQSLLTGEALPVARNIGDQVPGGAINAGNPIYLRVLRPSSDSTLSTIERLIERAALEKPAIALAADQVAGWFVVLLLVFAVGVFATWWWLEPARALPIAIAVLVVSCPCALSLATPAALAAATGAATRHGALVASGRALETMANATDVVFDKTGTLTEGRPQLAAAELTCEATREQALQMAAALETGSPHPLACALREAAAREAPDAAAAAIAATGLQQYPGLGVAGSIGGRDLRLGSRAFVSEWTELPAGTTSTGSEVWLVERGQPLAWFEFRDTLRPQAQRTVSALRSAGMRVHLLSGDHAAAVESTARELGIEQICAAASPAGKLAYVSRLQSAGACVLMVGDGINDAPVLAAANVSIAVGQATALARTSADVVLLHPDLGMIGHLLGLARLTRRVILQNLVWASAYNLAAIPAAALGWVPPWLAAVGMSTSSLLVVGNALRLRIAAPPPTVQRHPTAVTPTP